MFARVNSLVSWWGWERSGWLRSSLAHVSPAGFCLASVRAAALSRVRCSETLRQSRQWPRLHWMAGVGLLGLLGQALQPWQLCAWPLPLPYNIAEGLQKFQE